MNKFYLPLFSAVALFFAGCSESNETNEPTVEPAPVMVEFSAEAYHGEAASENGSRAFLSDLIAKWKANDKIALFAKSYKNKYQAATLAVKEVIADTKAKFEGEIVQPEEPDYYYAAYPETATTTDENVTFEVADTQTATTDPTTLMAAKTDEPVAMSEVAFNFKPVNSFLHVTLPEGSGITTVTFEGCNGENVAGSYTYNYDDGTTSVSGTTAITVTTDGATQFYITLPAMTLENGYKLTFSNAAAQKMVKSYGYNTGKTFAKGFIYDVTVSEFTPITVTLGTVKSSYSNPDEGLANATIFTSGSTVSGISSTLVRETGIRYTVKGQATETGYPVASSPKSMSFDLNIAASTELYEVVAYAKDIYGNTYTSAPQEVGVLGANPMVKASATSSYDTDGVVSKNNNFDLGGNGFRMTATVQDIAPSLVASTSFSYSGGRSASVGASLNGTSFTADVTGLAYNEWANYSVTGTATLGNGRSYSDNGSAVVTGIPYKSADFASSNDTAGWVLQGTTGQKSEKGLQIYYYYNYVFGTNTNSGNAFSPTFNLPESISVSYTANINFYTTGAGLGSATATIYTGITSNQSVTTTNSNSISRGTSGSSNITGCTHTGTMSSKDRISISHNSPNLKSNRAENWILIKDLSVSYN